MRDFRKGDVIRLKLNLPADTTLGVRQMQSGWEFEVLSSRDGDVRVKDGNGVKVILPVYAVELVRAAHSPEESGGDADRSVAVAVAAVKLPLAKRTAAMKRAA